jgi:hypothetical protein
VIAGDLSMTLASNLRLEEPVAVSVPLEQWEVWVDTAFSCHEMVLECSDHTLSFNASVHMGWYQFIVYLRLIEKSF